MEHPEEERMIKAPLSAILLSFACKLDVDDVTGKGQNRPANMILEIPFITSRLGATARAGALAPKPSQNPFQSL
eukprot:6326268-Amphidinium_carterae.1